MSLLPDGRRVDGLKVTELKKELEMRGLGRSGAKKDLVARLSEHIAKENVECQESESNQYSSPTAEIIDHHSEAENSQNKENDAVESSLIESDEEIANASTGTVIFVPKELTTTQTAPVSQGSDLPLDHQVKTAIAEEAPVAVALSTTMDSDTSSSLTERAGDGLDTSSTATETECMLASADKSPALASPAPTTSGGAGSEARTGEGEPQARRRALWGARSEAGGSAGQTIAFSTDTLEKMVPTLTVPEKTPSCPDVMPPDIDVAAPADRVSTTPAATCESRSSLESTADTSIPHHLSTADRQDEVNPCGQEYGKAEDTGTHAVDEEVVVMDATIEGGYLDIEAPPALALAPTAESASPKKPLATVDETEAHGDLGVHDHHGHDPDTRQVTRKRSAEAATDAEKKQSPVKRKGLKETKAVGYLVEQPERVEPCQVTSSPLTEFVHITCLVRPFTAVQLKQMITTAYGPVVDLWLNRIKSAAVVQFESRQAAVSCREGLDGSRWPSINPRVLRSDFVSQEFFNWMKEHGDTADMNPPQQLLSAGPATTGNPERDTRRGDDDRVGGAVTTPVASGGHNHRKSDDLRQKLSRRDGEAAVGPSERMRPGEASRPAGEQTKSEPSKMLDDLFRKTTTSPCIYWLPLTDEEAKQRALERLEQAAKRGGPGGTRATRSPFAAATASGGGGVGEAQRTDTAVPAPPLASDQKQSRKRVEGGEAGPGSSSASKSSRSVGGAGTGTATLVGTARSSSDKVSAGGRRQGEVKGSNELKEHRRDGSPFMSSEKKSETAATAAAGKPAHKPAGAPRLDGLSSSAGTRPSRRRSTSSSSNSSSSASSPSPKRRPRPNREVSPAARRSSGGRRASRSRSPAGGHAGRYRGRFGSSTAAEAFRRYRGASPPTHRSRR